MQPDIQDLTARGLKLLGKLGMLSPAERSLVDPYVACLELHLDETRPVPAQTATPSNVVDFEDAMTARRVQRAEVERRRVAEVRKPGQHRRVDEFGWEVYDDE